MLRHLGQPLERDPQTIHPRKGEVDPEDSVFVIYLHPKAEPDKPQMPVIASIWLSLQEAKSIAERYIQNGDPFNSGEFGSVSVVEYEVGRLVSSSQRHFDRVFPKPPEPLPEDPLARMQRLEEELAEMRAKHGIGITATTFAPNA